MPCNVVNDDCVFFLFLALMNEAIRTFVSRFMGARASPAETIPRTSDDGLLPLDPACLVLQDRQGEAIVVPSLRITDLGLRLLQLCLTQLHNRA